MSGWGFALQYFGGLVCSSVNASIILNPDIGRLWLTEEKPSSTVTSDWLLKKSKADSGVEKIIPAFK